MEHYIKARSYLRGMSENRELLIGKLRYRMSHESVSSDSEEDSKPKGNTLPSEEPEVVCVWDSREAKAKEPEVICLSSDSSDSEENSKAKKKTFISSETQTDDFPDVCERDVERQKLEAKSISKLIGHLDDLLLEGSDHDVTIKVKNREFKAHKNLLRARSPVFAAMFEHNMEETTTGIVSIDDCDPDTFDGFLKFVYTGKTEFDSTKSAISLYYAGDKYDFLELKEMCVKHIMKSLTTTAICDVIKMAMTHDEADLLQCASSFFSHNLEEILKTVEWQRFLQVNPLVANEMYIKAIKIAYRKVQ